MLMSEIFQYSSLAVWCLISSCYAIFSVAVPKLNDKWIGLPWHWTLETCLVLLSTVKCNSEASLSQNNNSMNFILCSENLTYHQWGEWKLQFQTKFDFTAKIQPREELKHQRKSHFLRVFVLRENFFSVKRRIYNDNIF